MLAGLSCQIVTTEFAVWIQIECSMKPIEESVVTAMDGSDKLLYPYLPYILQDIWELGASPEIIIDLIKKHKRDFESLKILDLGSGKGAVSIKIAKELKCNCFGIDAVQEFVDQAVIMSMENNVREYCKYEVADIRTKRYDEPEYDIIILGAIGSVFGDYYSTLKTIKNCLLPDGLIIIDDSYVIDNSNYSHPRVQKKSRNINQIADAKMKIIDEVIISADSIKKSNKEIIDKIKLRCGELIKKEPENKYLFENYIKDQEYENEVLEQEVISSTIVIRNI